jgi:hypothetical protein
MLRNILRKTYKRGNLECGKEKEQMAYQPGDPGLLAGLAPPGGALTSTQLHARTAEALKRVQTDHWLVITHYNNVEGYLVSPEQLEFLRSSVVELEALRQEVAATLPLVLAAARSGVAIPSEALRRLVPNMESSWADVATFAATAPVRISRGEAGEGLERGRLRAAGGRVEEADDDDLNLDA